MQTVPTAQTEACIIFCVILSYPLKVEHFFAHVMIMKATESTYCSYGQGNDVWGIVKLTLSVTFIKPKGCHTSRFKKKKRLPIVECNQYNIYASSKSKLAVNRHIW